MPRRLGPKRGINRGEMAVDAGHRRVPLGSDLDLNLYLYLYLYAGVATPFFVVTLPG